MTNSPQDCVEDNLFSLAHQHLVGDVLLSHLMHVLTEKQCKEQSRQVVTEITQMRVVLSKMRE